MIGIAASFGAFAQLPVSTSPENKNVVLEEFTGIACTWCPAGHLIGNTLAADNPGDVVLINIHTGGFANPQGAGTDFRTSFGTAIAGQTNLAGYPAGTVNRHEFAGLQQNNDGTGTAMGRGNWTAAADQILGEASYANVALEGSIDFLTREMTVDVEVHFTGTAPASVNLNVAVMQNNVEGPQTGSAGNPDNVLPNGNYNHGHMLRHLITGQWGEVISTTTQGTTYSQSFTYSIPDDINDVAMELADLEIAAFIAEGQQEVITGAKGPITFTNAPENNVTVKDLMPGSACDLTLEPQVEIKNTGGNEITSMRIRYHLSGQNVTIYDWTGSIAGFGTETITLPSIAVPTDVGTQLTTRVGLVNATADTDPSDNEMVKPVGVVSGSDFTFEFSQDRYGSESTWEIVDDAGTVLYSGGPYANLASNTTLLHATPITLASEGCYSINVVDSYGDGINSGYGEGMFELIDNAGASVLSHDGVFGADVSLEFNIISSTPLTIGNEETVTELSIYPNPVTNMANIQFFLTDANNASITVHNILGEVVYTNANLNQGQNIINFDAVKLGSGMYFATINNENETTSAKFTVAK